MTNHPRSFRRNLLVRILAFSLPILFIGQAIVLRKARTSLLTTARQNLTSSATRKAEELETGIQSVEATLDVLAQTEDFQTGDVDAIRVLLNRFTQDVTPYTISCFELKAPKSQTSAINTCVNDFADISTPLPTNAPLEPAKADVPGDGANVSTPDASTPAPTEATLIRSIVPSAKQVPWLQDGGVKDADFYVFSLGLGRSLTAAELATVPENRALIKFIVASPIYSEAGELIYTLAMEVHLFQLQDAAPQSLVGETVVIDQNQVIVTHPDISLIGKNISELGDADKLSNAIGSVKAGKSEFVHLFRFLSGEDGEWLAGYSGFEVPVSPKQNKVWTVLAVTPLDRALHGLTEIRQILFALNSGLLIASVGLALYVSRSLSLPIERLIRYTQDVDDLSSLKAAPKGSKIWELNYLGTVIERMLRRLEENAAELRRAWQDAQAANQLKNEFLANTSHELRTPLNGIIGSIHLVRDELCDSREEEMDFLEQANKAALHLLSVIEDILNIAKIEAGKLDVDINPVDLRHVLQDVLEIEGSQFQKKGLRLIGPELTEPLIIPVDHSRFKQVLLNVLSNAIKFTDEGAMAGPSQGEIAITVTTDESPEEPIQLPGELYLPSEPWVKITIQDSGIGIDPQHLSKLFKPFVMIDGSHTRPYEGTGLGLALSQNFMRLMQGDISIYSQGVGQGTTVTIVLPRVVKNRTDDDTETDETDTGKSNADDVAMAENSQTAAMTLRQ
ncbi:MAG: ATP-binding protein [Cyanobacteria bacterium P01_C01_bin.121]